MAEAIGSLDDMLFFPYNSVQNEFGEDDRLYDSQDWADYFKQFIGNGVFPNPSSGLRVDSLNGSMVLTVRMGAAFASGRLYMQKGDFEFSVAPAHLTLGRRDVVVCRHDNINRTMQVLYIAGTPSSVPAVPDIVRTDDIFDLKLCEITVGANAQMVTQANILDTRLNSAVCGIVHGLVDQVDTTAIFEQYEAYLAERITEWGETKAQQSAEFTAAMEGFDTEWRQMVTGVETWQGQIDAWYDAVRTDISLLQSFNFDNLAVLPGAARSTVFNTDGNITERIARPGGGLVAERETVFNVDGSIAVTVTVYNDDGVTTQYISRITTTFNVDGSIEEEVIHL